MKKFLLLLCTLLVGMGGVKAQIVTDYSTAGSPVTFDTYVASAGTGAKYAFMMPSANSATLHNWCGFNSTVGRATTLTPDFLFTLENSTNDGKYWLKRYSNSEYLAGNNSFSATTPIDLTLVNRTPGDYADEYSSSDLHISFDAYGGHFNNGNGSYDFAGGTGGWSTCIAYGPFYVDEVECVDTENTPIQSVTYIVKGNTTITAPAIPGYKVQGTGSASVSGNADETVKFTYSALPAFDPSNVSGKTFTLQCARGYVYYNGTQLAGTSTASSASKFAVVTYDGATYLYDATQNAFVCHTTAATQGYNGNNALESNNDFSKAVKNISFGATNIEAYPYYVQEDQFTNWLNMDGSPLVYFNRWTDFESGNGGNTYKIEIVDTDFDDTNAVAMLDAYFNPSATVQYVISDGINTVFTSEAIPTAVGETITALPVDYQRVYCSYSAINQTMVAGANIVNVTVTYNLPFTVSTDFDNATWYYATIRDTKYLRADDSNKDGSGRYTTNSTNEETDAYKWAFYGNPYTYFYIANKGQGEGKFLNAGSVPTFETIADPASTNAALWEPIANGTGFTLRSITGANLYINDAGNGGNLGYWESSYGRADAGGRWNVEEVPTLEAEFAAIIAQLEALSFGSELGQYTLTGEFAGYAGNEAAIISGLKTQGYSEYNLTIAQGMLDAISLNMPTGKFIRLYNEARGVYMGTAASGKHPNASSVDDAGIYFVASDGKILSVDQAAYLENKAGAPCVSAAYAGTFTISDAGNGKYYVNCGGYLVAWTSASDRLGSPDEYAVWTITEVEDYEHSVTISSAGYATLSFPVALTIPSGVQAYAVSALTPTEATLTEITGSIPASTPVILKGNAGNYTFATTTSEAYAGTNHLTAALGKVNVAADYAYTLQQNVAGTAVGLFPKAAGEIAGFKAYMLTSELPAEGGEVKGIAFRLDSADGVKNVDLNVNLNDKVYDLSGRRVSQPTRGLYIVNGKKVAVK